MKSIKQLLLMLAISVTSAAYGQDIAVKTNVLDDLILDINIGTEIGLAPKWTVDIPLSINDWNLSHDRRWKHLSIQPGVRYWFCDRFSGHFVGLHTHGGIFNMGGFDGKINMLGTDFTKLANSRFQGWFIGGGISYGYAWMLGTHWNIEAEIGFGYSYSRYDQFRCAGCGKKVRSNMPHNYVGPTKAAVNMVYLF
ncbi:DUF3575 domain-containing protein [uncultured Duncaniella sp.]|uniref:DUF3575 domain-containing protein n=1 Tax=uncultured Duncaniella sp. TaxID=2768039 RepID=UPI0025D6D43F|nr:DUF3575 domain-containing protein [uncultured Duncaniella sp.]